jgi:hypothetical protein
MTLVPKNFRQPPPVRLPSAPSPARLQHPLLQSLIHIALAFASLHLPYFTLIIKSKTFFHSSSRSERKEKREKQTRTTSDRNHNLYKRRIFLFSLSLSHLNP